MLTPAKPGLKSAAGWLPDSIEMYRAKLVADSSRNATFVVTFTDDIMALDGDIELEALTVMVTSTELPVKAWTLLLRTLISCSNTHESAAAGVAVTDAGGSRQEATALMMVTATLHA